MSTTRNVLVTGGAGFIGTHLVGLLLERGDRVTVIDDLTTGRSDTIERFRANPSFRFAIASIMDEAVLDRVSSEADVIIHLAAAVGVQLIVERPVHTIETNVMGTELVLRAARRYNAKVMIASTSEVYGKGARIPFSEEDDVLLGPTSKNRWAYAASKLVDEFLALAYHREHGMPVVIARLFNTVGPGQRGRYGMVLPRFVKQALAGEPVTVFGDGSQSRCFCDVRDTIRALAALTERDEAIGSVFNVGGSHEVTINELAERVIRRTGSSSTIEYVPYSDAYAEGFEDMARRVPDTSRIAELIGWKPAIGLDETIDAVAAAVRSSP